MSLIEPSKELPPQAVRHSAQSPDDPVPAWMLWGLLLLLIVLLYAWRPTYVSHLLVMFGIYLLLSTSLNLVTGFGGLMSFSHAAFYGIGAYAYAVARLQAGPSGDQAESIIWAAGWPFVPAILFAMAVGALFGWLVSLVTLRFRGDYFVFATLGIQMIIFSVLYNWVELVRGPYGLYGIPRPDLFGWSLRDSWQYLLMLVPVVTTVVGALWIVYRSEFGLKLKAMREDERAAMSTGIATNRMAGLAMTIAAGVAALAGASYASYVTYIDPTSFSLSESIFLVALLMLGGAGNLTGPVVGTLIMVALPEAMRFVGLPDAVAANVREIIYGGLLAGLMFWRPQGIAGERFVGT
ncbi:MAG: branched-chain amino acid ABC transporter permease [Pirellulaceae bacterium]|nr:branched-chain amino acid ABC transporter permease [Pirellulaceae bacterium]